MVRLPTTVAAAFALGLAVPSVSLASDAAFTVRYAVSLYRHGTSDRVPSFARRYGLSCSTCHTVFPALNEYGRLFRAKGYRLPGAGETIEGERPLGLGPTAEAPEARKASGIPFIDIPATSVASFQVQSDFRYTPDEEVKTEFTGISSFGLIFGGALGRSFSFFGNVALWEDGRFEGIDRLFVQYNPGLALNFRVGEFEPRAIPFSNHRRLLRVTPYLNGIFPMIPAQNFFGFSPNQKGIEAFGRAPGLGGIGELEYAVGLVNGEAGAAFEVLKHAEGPASDLVRELEGAYEASGGEFDVNNSKDVYARVNYLVWLRGALSVGGFVYRGTAGFLQDQNDPDTFIPDGNTFTRWGLDLRWDQENGFLSALASVQFLDERLDRPLLNNPSAMLTTGELQVYVVPWFVPGFRYERVDVDGFPSGAADNFGRYSAEVLVLLGSNAMLMFGTSWSDGAAPNLPLFEKFTRAALHLAF